MSAAIVSVIVVSARQEEHAMYYRLSEIDPGLHVAAVFADAATFLAAVRTLPAVNVAVLDTNLTLLEVRRLHDLTRVLWPRTKTVLLHLPHENVSPIAAPPGQLLPLAKPVSLQQLASAIHRFAGPRAPDTPVAPRLGNLTIVHGGKAGSGVTTVAVLLAAALHAATGWDVVLVDGNGERDDARGWFPDGQITDLDTLMRQIGRLGADREAILPRHPTGLRLLTSGQLPTAAAPNVLRTVLQVLGSVVDHVVVDLSADVDPRLAAAVLPLAASVLIVATPSPQTTAPTLAAVQRLLQVVAAPQVVGLVLNRVAPADARRAFTPLLAVTGRPVVAEIPEDAPRVRDSQERGAPCVFWDPSAPIAQASFDLAHLVSLGGRWS